MKNKAFQFFFAHELLLKHNIYKYFGSWSFSSLVKAILRGKIEIGDKQEQSLACPKGVIRLSVARFLTINVLSTISCQFPNCRVTVTRGTIKVYLVILWSLQAKMVRKVNLNSSVQNWKLFLCFLPWSHFSKYLKRFNLCTIMLQCYKSDIKLTEVDRELLVAKLFTKQKLWGLPKQITLIFSVSIVCSSPTTDFDNISAVSWFTMSVT